LTGVLGRCTLVQSREDPLMAFIFTRVLKNRSSVSVYGSRTFRTPGGGTKSKQTYLGKIEIRNGAVTLNARHREWLAEHGLGPEELKAALSKAADKHGLSLALPGSWACTVQPQAGANPSGACGSQPFVALPEGSPSGSLPVPDSLQPAATSAEPAEAPGAALRETSAEAEAGAGAREAHSLPRPAPGIDFAGEGLAYGHVHLLKHLSLELGLSELLGRLFPAVKDDILALAFYSACEGGPLESFGSFARRALCPGSSRPLSPVDITYLLSEISHGDVLNFFRQWRERLGAEDLEAYAIQPGGASPDGSLLREIRLCAVFGKGSGLPAGLSVLHGPPDSPGAFAAAALRAAGLPPDAAEVPQAASDGNPAASGALAGAPGTRRAAISLYGNEGLFSRTSLAWLAREAQGFGFSLPLTETDPAFQDILMDILTNSADDQIILPSPDGQGQLIGFAKRTEIGGLDLFASVFLDRYAKSRAEDAVLFNALDMLDAASADPERHSDDPLFREALQFPDSGEGLGGAVEIRPDLIQSLTFANGWNVRISDREAGLPETLRLRGKERLFSAAFSGIGSGPKESGGSGIWGEILVAFTALALSSRLYDAMDEAGLFESHTLKGLLDGLGLIRAARVEAGIVCGPADRESLRLFEALRCPPPDGGAF
jgi:hypothetical protein